MSFSECFACGETVPHYEKWCKNCLDRFGLKQGDWRKFTPITKHDSKSRTAEVFLELMNDSALPDAKILKLYLEQLEK